ncbi:hypothetical protein ACVMB3_005068 [Sinorhizobium meliloti]
MGLKRRRDSAPLIMRDQYVATLNALGMDAFGRPSDGHRQLSEIKKSVESLLRNDPTWVQVFEAEQLLLEVLPDTTVNAELERRLFEGEALSLKSFDHFRSAAADAQSSEEKRAILAAVVRDLQKFFIKKRVDRFERYDSGSRLFAISLIVLLAVVVPFAFQDQLSGALVSNTFFALVYAPVAVGSAGALFSRLVTFQNTSETLDYDALKNAYLVRWILLRMAVGVFGAFVIQVAIRGELITGDLFPKLKNPTEIDVMKLLVWSFLGGFSERLVPRTLEGIEGRVTKIKNE